MKSGHKSYCLPRNGLDALAKGFSRKMKPVLVLDEVSRPFKVLDCFDQPLRRSNRLLLEVDVTLELLTPDGAVLTQPAKRSGDFVADFESGPVKQALADVSPLRCLLPVGSGNLRRGLLTLVDSSGNTLCRAYLTVLRTDGGEAAIVRPKGLRGNDKSLAKLRKKIKGCGGKAAPNNLYSDLFPNYPTYDATPEVIINPDTRAFDAATAIIAAYIPVLRANEPGIIADHDTEFLHDYRIALRKIRLVLGMFKGVYETDQSEDLKTRFSALMSPTGRLRDLDVHLLKRQDFHKLIPKPLHGGLDMMFALLAQERQVEKAALASHLAGAAYEKEITDLAELFEGDIGLRRGRNADRHAHEFASHLIRKRYRKIRRIIKTIRPETDAAQFHRLRIQCKKLRYLMEFFGALYPRRELASLVKNLKSLQDHLGAFNDYSVQQASLQEFLSGGGVPLDNFNSLISQSAGALIAVLHDKRLKERKKVVESFTRFSKPAVRNTFRNLFRGRKKVK